MKKIIIEGGLFLLALTQFVLFIARIVIALQAGELLILGMLLPATLILLVFCFSMLHDWLHGEPIKSMS